jgi:hypothetical protein
MPASAAPDQDTLADDGVVLRPMTADDLAAAHALSEEQRWPHRPADWAQMFAHADEGSAGAGARTTPPSAW